MKVKLVTPYRVKISTVTMLRQHYDTSQLDCAKHYIESEKSASGM